jgi:hypothetical protein
MKLVGFTRSQYREFIAAQQKQPNGSTVQCPVIIEQRNGVVISICGEKLPKSIGDSIVMCEQHTREACAILHKQFPFSTGRLHNV